MVETGGPRGERLEADDLAFGEASRSRLDGSRLNTEGGLPSLAQTQNFEILGKHSFLLQYLREFFPIFFYGFSKRWIS